MVMMIAPIVIAVIFVLNECKILSFFQLLLQKILYNLQYFSPVHKGCFQNVNDFL